MTQGTGLQECLLSGVTCCSSGDTSDEVAERVPRAKILGFLETFQVDVEAEVLCLTGICSDFSHVESNSALVI